MNNTKKLMAASFAVGSILLCDQMVIMAEEQEPVVDQDAIVETNNTVDEEVVDEQKDSKETTDEEVTDESLEQTNSAGTLSDDGETIYYRYSSDTSVEKEDAILNQEFKPKNTVDGDTLTVICDALTTQNKDELVNILSQCYKEDGGNSLGTDIPVKIINDDFIDTNKWSLSDDFAYDGYQCWANTAANVLWSTGWAKTATDPLTGELFSSVDEVAMYFATYFTDKGSFAEDGFTWFFDGNYSVHVKNEKGEETAAQLTKGDENKYTSYNYGEGMDKLGGTLTDYCANPIINKVAFKGNDLDKISNLEKLGTEFGAGLTIQFNSIDKATGKETEGTRHAITIAGVIIDPSDTSVNRYKALLIADSDNNTCKGTEVPANADVSWRAKEKVAASYTMYYLKPYTDTKGNQWWELVNYNLSSDTKESHTIICDYQTLQKMNETSKETALETDKDAKKDTLHYSDLVLTYTEMDDAKSNAQNVYGVGSEIYLYYSISNPSKVNYKSAENDPTIHTVTVYKDDVVYYSYNIAANLVLDADSSVAFLSQLNDEKTFETGTYTVSITINAVGTNGRYAEAYYVNNTLKPLEFSVTAGEGDDGEEEESDKKEDVVTPSVQNVTVNTSQSTNTVNTGISTSYGFFASLMIASVGAILTSIKKLRH